MSSRGPMDGKNDKGRIIQALAIAAECMRVELSEAAMLAYVAVLDDLPAAGVVEAIESIMRTASYMPRPADIRRAATGNIGFARAKVALDAALRRGRTISPRFQDQALQLAVSECGGWSFLCLLDEDEYKKYVLPRIKKAWELYDSRRAGLDKFDPPQLRGERGAVPALVTVRGTVKRDNKALNSGASNRAQRLIAQASENKTINREQDDGRRETGQK